MWEFQYDLLYHTTAGTVLPLQICCLHMATPVHQEKKRQGSWFRGEKTGAKGSGGAITKHPPPPRQKKM
jgi:hypothetical protein